MEVIKVTPRGYCYGVVDALKLVRQAAANPDIPRPIYIIGQIVHNRILVEEMNKLGVTTLEGPNRLHIIEGVKEGTVIFTAHGVSPAVKERARARGLHIIDATCPDVSKTHNLILEVVPQGYEVIYIGKKGHPEPEGAIGEAPGKVYLVETPEDVAALNLSNTKLVITTQTTLSKWDTQKIIDTLLVKYPSAEVHNEICLATQTRQEAVVKQAPEAEMVVVVGDPHSNNTNRLVQVAQELAGRPAYRIESVQDINPEWLVGKNKVAVTSGASTPSEVTREVIRYLENYPGNSR